MTRFSGRGLAVLVALAVGQPLAAQTLPGTAPAARGGFGNAMAVGPDAVFIGEANNVINPGLVYVYTRSADGWEAAGRLVGGSGRPAPAERLEVASAL